MSIARSLFNLVDKAALEKKATRITTINANVGRFAGVEIELLRRAFDVLTKGTMAENSELQITVIDFVIQCNTCAQETIKDEIDMQCPACKNTDTRPISGQDIFLTDFEITI
ncbi:MAG: hydrogenase maturation nickel metallochaperone HypA [Leptospirales bacterium]